MAGWGICHAPFKEAGPWFEIQCVKEVITGKESRGKDASFERGLLRAWSSYEGYEGAKEALRSILKPSSHS
jgi:hypothetical protein